MIRIRRAVVSVILCFVSIVSAKAEPIQISELLKKGYEIKSAYALQAFEGRTAPAASSSDYNSLMARSITHFIILQKADSAYWCNDNDAKYVNDFQCWAVLDFEKKQQ